jgi:hypothetical protein
MHCLRVHDSRGPAHCADMKVLPVIAQGTCPFVQTASSVHDLGRARENGLNAVCPPSATGQPQQAGVQLQATSVTRASAPRSCARERRSSAEGIHQDFIWLDQFALSSSEDFCDRPTPVIATMQTTVGREARVPRANRSQKHDVVELRDADLVAARMQHTGLAHRSQRANLKPQSAW